MMKAKVCIVNFNCGGHTRELIGDLLKQTYEDFSVTLYDQGSKDQDSLDLYRDYSNHPRIKVIYNAENRPLNHIWNDFANSEEEPDTVLIFLNNDIRISRYHVEQTVSVFKEYGTSIVVHASNNRNYRVSSQELKFVEECKEVKQGWEYSILQKDWINIPKVLMFYCGDDFVFHQMFKKGHRVKTITSSPVIHKLSQTRQSVDEETAKVIKSHAFADIATYKRLGYPHYWNNLPMLSRLKPEFDVIEEG